MKIILNLFLVFFGLISVLSCSSLNPNFVKISVGDSTEKVEKAMTAPFSVENNWDMEAWQWCSTGGLSEDSFYVIIFHEGKVVKKISYQQSESMGSCRNLFRPIAWASLYKYRKSSRPLAEYGDDLTPLINAYASRKVDPRKWLFVIAIEKYKGTADVNYSKKSAEVFKIAAQKIFGIKERNTYALIENDATSGAIKDSLTKLIRNIRHGDIIYFYYSGHGVPAPKSKEAFILPKDKMVDYIEKDKAFKLSSIYKKLASSKASKVFAFVDACFSGKTDNKFIFKGVAPGLIRSKKIKFDENKMAIMSAGKDHQFSNSHDEKKYRMFSYYLIKSLLEKKNRDLRSVFRDVFSNVKDKSWAKGDTYFQEPQLRGNRRLDLFN